jgi:hypothetical protein
VLGLCAMTTTIVEQDGGGGGEEDNVGALSQRCNDCQEAHGMLGGSVLPRQEGSGVEVAIIMLFGGACAKVWWWGEHGVCHSQRWR